MPIDPSRSVAELVLERPARARVFEQLGLDYCCGGKLSLTEACAARGVDPDAAAAALEQAADATASEDVDWSAAPLARLCDHIVDVHHARLRADLPRLSVLLQKVERAHGEGRPELASMRETFETLRAELEAHVTEEEERLFVACRSGDSVDPAMLTGLEETHAATGEALATLRRLSSDYDLAGAFCNTHRAALDGLHELELDLHQHIHEENNVLFPRVLARAG